MVFFLIFNLFLKPKKPLKTLSSGPNIYKKQQKKPKNQKNPLGWFFFFKPGFFPTLLQGGLRQAQVHSGRDTHTETDPPLCRSRQGMK
jgi:hypothetical protein